MKIKREKEIPKGKIKVVKDMIDLLKNKKTILLTSIANIPASQFQEISKKLRGKAIIKVPKKRLIFRAIEDSNDENLEQVKKYIKDNIAVLFSDMDTFELAGELVRNQTKGRAKVGQEAPEDIEIQAGPTDLVPGPAISELGVLGIQIQIEKGKIAIKEPKTIVKKGEKISRDAANIMSKLDIKPITIGFTPLAAFDTQEKKLYLDIKIDREGTLNELKYSFSKALPFAVEIGYISDDTIKFLIGKAGMHEKAIGNLVGKEKDNSSTDKEVDNKNSESEVNALEENKSEGEEKQ
jgi:large subunit ribosomal protein L10